MCGIVAIAGPHEESTLQRLNLCQTHRGPNDAGWVRSDDGNVGLAMTRLSILDLSGGHQPMSADDGRLWIVYNGEVFNAPKLREELKAKGRHFRTANSDTEVLLQLYLDRGERMLDDLNGMFSFVIHDRAKNRLFCARDRFGIKPFYYAFKNGVFAAASEAKTLLTLPHVTRAIDPQAVSDFLTLGYVPSPASIFSDIRKLPAGHALTLDLTGKQITTRRYYTMKPRAGAPADAKDWPGWVKTELRAAVLRWTLSDVPIGCSLSGGLDSSAVVALLAESGGQRVKTFSLGFEGTEGVGLNELPLARQVAERYGTDHHESVLKPEELLNDLPAMVWHLDEPYGGGLPSWYVFRFMARDVRVGFTGTGGDEIFGDYGKWLPLEKSAFGRDVLEGGVIGRLARTLPPFADPIEKKYLRPFYYLSAEEKRSALGPGLRGTLPTSQLFLSAFGARPFDDFRDNVAALDFVTQLPDEFLHMTDRFSMAHSLEARVPFLDHEFVEKMFGIPGGLRTRLRDLKGLLRRAVSDLLPPDLLNAQKKGFVIPAAAWLRGPLKAAAEKLLSPDRLTAQGLLSPVYYQRLLKEHSEGRDHHKRLWNAFMFQLWHWIFIEHPVEARPTGSVTDLL